jgi:hypothetical protein
MVTLCLSLILWARPFSYLGAYLVKFRIGIRLLLNKAKCQALAPSPKTLGPGPNFDRALVYKVPLAWNFFQCCSGVCIPFRVTRLGNSLHSLGRFFENYKQQSPEILGYFFPRKKLCIKSRQKLIGPHCGRLLANASGHPGSIHLDFQRPADGPGSLPVEPELWRRPPIPTDLASGLKKASESLQRPKSSSSEASETDVDGEVNTLRLRSEVEQKRAC